MLDPFCWHRPVKFSPSGKFRTCRHCGIGIQICECDTCFRKPDPKCEMCWGSGWRAIVRGRVSQLLAAMADYA